MYHARLADAWQPCPQVPCQICATLCVPSCVPLLKGALSNCADIHDPSWQVPHVAQYLSWKHALRSYQCTACARRATCTCCCVMGASVCVAVAAGQHMFRKCVFCQRFFLTAAGRITRRVLPWLCRIRAFALRSMPCVDKVGLCKEPPRCRRGFAHR
jgi:hypothetical protein